jgi:hypothetical protein
MWLWNKRALAFGDALAGGFEQRLEEGVDLLRLAVVGVEGDQHVVFFREEVAGLGEDDGTEGGVLDGGAGGEFAAAGGDLDDAVGLGFGEGAQRAVDGGDRGDVDGGVGIAALLGGVQHGAVLRGSCDWHNGLLVSPSAGRGQAGIGDEILRFRLACQGGRGWFV